MQPKDVSGKIYSNKEWKIIEGMGGENVHLKYELHTKIIKKKIIIQLRQNMINMVIKFQCMKM